MQKGTTFVKAQFQRELHEKYRHNVPWNFTVTESLIRRLGLSAELDGHTGCVNCLEWNEEGTILASGSDDVCINLWDPFRKKLLMSIASGHHGNIFSVKFIPKSRSNLVVSGAADNKIRIHDVTAKELLSMCSCHTSRVKRIATDPTTSYLFWSAGEEGAIIQHDLRAHKCTSDPKDPQNILIDLRHYCGSQAEAKCLAINPLQPELMAVGANDAYVRLYDRRMIKESWSESYKKDGMPLDAVQYFVPGHLPWKMTEYKRSRSIASTFVAFSPDGRDLLVNLGGEQIYLFPLVHSEQRFPVSFSTSLSSANSNDDVDVQEESKKPRLQIPKKNGSKAGGAISLPGADTKVVRSLPKEIEAIKIQANHAYGTKKYARAIHMYNDALQACEDSPILLGNRAAAYLKRAWDGDVYAALMDCHKALQLDNKHYKAHLRLCRCLYELNRLQEAEEWLEDFRETFSAHMQSPTFSKLEEDLRKKVEAAAAKKKKEKEKKNKSNTQTERCESPAHSRNYFLRFSQSSSENSGSPNEGSRPASEEESTRVFVPAGIDLDGENSGSGLHAEGFVFDLKSPDIPLRDDDETVLKSRGIDFTKRYCGHCNTTTDIKEANFFGNYIIAGSDDGSFFIWDKKTCNIVRILKGDESIVNCLQPHPSTCMLATSGIENYVRLWSPMPEEGGKSNEREIEDVDDAASSNQKRMAYNPANFLNLFFNMDYRLNADEDNMDEPQESTVQCNAT